MSKSSLLFCSRSGVGYLSDVSVISPVSALYLQELKMMNARTVNPQQLPVSEPTKVLSDVPTPPRSL